MITLTIFLVFSWIGIGAWVTAKFSYWIEDKYDLCGACIHYILLMLWMVLPIGIGIDLGL
jgi:hypothetical protein